LFFRQQTRIDLVYCLLAYYPSSFVKGLHLLSFYRIIYSTQISKKEKAKLLFGLAFKISD